MIGYVTLGTNDMTRAGEFYDTLLAEVVVHALINIGRAECLMGDPAGPLKLERGIALARARGLHEYGARAHVHLVYQAVG